ncbi:hypothetical protein Tco_1576081 [Tanacetum coccineum]
MLVTAVVWWRCRWLRGGSGSQVVLMMVTAVVRRMLWCRRGGVRRWGWCCSGMEMVETKVRVAVVVWRGGREGRCMAWWWRRWRVEESGCGDRIDPVRRSVFGVGRKSPPEKFSGGGSGGRRRPVAGIRWRGGEEEDDKIQCGNQDVILLSKFSKKPQESPMVPYGRMV